MGSKQRGTSKDQESAFGKLTDFISEHESFLLMTHRGPDGDAIGSALGMAHYLKSIGKRIGLVDQDEVPRRLRFLPGSDWFFIADDAAACDESQIFEAVITLDAADEKQLGSANEWIQNGKPILNIDHHFTNSLFGHVNVVDMDAASSTQVVYNYLKFINATFTYEIAISLYTGLVTDTGGFRHGNTTAAVHEMAADLLTYEIQPFEISDRVLTARTIQGLRLTQIALQTLEMDESGRLAWVTITREQMQSCGAKDEDLEELIELPRSIETVEVAVLFKEREDGDIKISLRSKYLVDVSQIALYFGGGGHQRAAGCTLLLPMKEAEHEILNSIRKELDQYGV